jgi:hypothetical protein
MFSLEIDFIDLIDSVIIELDQTTDKRNARDSSVVLKAAHFAQDHLFELRAQFESGVIVDHEALQSLHAFFLLWKNDKDAELDESLRVMCFKFGDFITGNTFTALRRLVQIKKVGIAREPVMFIYQWPLRAEMRQ